MQNVARKLSFDCWNVAYNSVQVAYIGNNAEYTRIFQSIHSPVENQITQLIQLSIGEHDLDDLYTTVTTAPIKLYQ